MRCASGPFPAPPQACWRAFFNAVPALVVVAVTLTVTWYIAKFAAGLGPDLLPARMGLSCAVTTSPASSTEASNTAAPAVTPPGGIEGG